MTEEIKNVETGAEEIQEPEAKEIDYTKPIVNFGKKENIKAFFNYEIDGEIKEIIVPSKIPYSFLKSLLKFQKFIEANSDNVNEEYFDNISKVVSSVLKMKNDDALIDKLIDIIDYEDFLKLNEAISQHITNILAKKKVT